MFKKKTFTTLTFKENIRKLLITYNCFSKTQSATFATFNKSEHKQESEQLSVKKITFIKST